MSMLVSLSKVKAYLGVTTSDFDAFLTEQIKTVSDAIEAYCRRKFELTTFTETFYSDDNRASSKITLFAYPVKSIVSVTEDTNPPYTDYRVQKSNGILIRPDGFFYGDQTVIVYQAGFDEIPSTVTSVVYSLVQERFTRKKAGAGLSFGSDVQRVSIPGALSIDFDYSLSNNDQSTAFGMILGSYLNVLDYYRSDRAILGNNKLVYAEAT